MMCVCVCVFQQERACGISAIFDVQKLEGTRLKTYAGSRRRRTCTQTHATVLARCRELGMDDQLRLPKLGGFCYEM